MFCKIMLMTALCIAAAAVPVRAQDENDEEIASAESIDVLVDDFAQMRRDIDNLRRSIDTLTQALQRDLSEDELKTLRKKQSKDIAEILLRFQDRVDYAEQQITVMTGQMEELQFQIVPMQETLQTLQNSTGTLSRINAGKQSNLAELLAAQTAVLQKQQETIANQSRAIERLEKNHNALIEQLKSSTSLNGEAAKKRSKAEPAVSKIPNQLYEDAVTLLTKNKDYLKARKKLEAFTKQYPEHKLIDNVSYWLGETYYVNQEYTQAAEKFLHSYQTYPKSQKAPDSLLKLGLSLLGAEQKQGACGAFEEFEQKFSSKRKDLLKRVKKESAEADCA